MGAQHTLVRQRVEIAELQKENGSLHQQLKTVYALFDISYAQYRNEDLIKAIKRLQTALQIEVANRESFTFHLEKENEKLWNIMHSVLKVEHPQSPNGTRAVNF